MNVISTSWSFSRAWDVFMGYLLYVKSERRNDWFSVLCCSLPQVMEGCVKNNAYAGGPCLTGISRKESPFAWMRPARCSEPELATGRYVPVDDQAHVLQNRKTFIGQIVPVVVSGFQAIYG